MPDADGPSAPPPCPPGIPATGGYYKPVPDVSPPAYPIEPIPVDAPDGKPVVCRNLACPYHARSTYVEFSRGPGAFRCEWCTSWTD